MGGRKFLTLHSHQARQRKKEYPRVPSWKEKTLTTHLAIYLSKEKKNTPERLPIKFLSCCLGRKNLTSQLTIYTSQDIKKANISIKNVRFVNFSRIRFNST